MRCISTFSQESYPISSVGFSSNDNYVRVGMLNDSINMVSLKNNQVVRTFNGKQYSV
jgi:hypothetical protein